MLFKANNDTPFEVHCVELNFQLALMRYVSCVPHFNRVMRRLTRDHLTSETIKSTQIGNTSKTKQTNKKL